MHTMTMEGLVGANTNMKLLNTPLRVYKEARQRGDTSTMERAMGFVNECSSTAEEYMAKTEEGMKKDAKEAREKERIEREDAIQKRKIEREEQEKRIEESRNKNTDTVEISENGKIVWSENTSSDRVVQDGDVSAEIKTDSVKMKPVIYTNTGEVSQCQSEANVSISVSI